MQIKPAETIKTINLLFKIYLIAFLFGFIGSRSETLLAINFIIKIIMSVYLLYLFYWLKRLSISDFDRIIVVNCSIYILMFSFTDLFIQYIDEIHNFFRPYFATIEQTLFPKKINNILETGTIFSTIIEYIS